MSILGVDFDQYFRSECSIRNQYSHRNICQNQPQKLIFFNEILHTTKYKHIFNHIAKQNYEFVPKIFVNRLISFSVVHTPQLTFHVMEVNIQVALFACI